MDAKTSRAAQREKMTLMLDPGLRNHIEMERLRIEGETGYLVSRTQIVERMVRQALSGANGAQADSNDIDRFIRVRRSILGVVADGMFLQRLLKCDSTGNAHLALKVELIKALESAWSAPGEAT
jgi:hypothetical protein